MSPRLAQVHLRYRPASDVLSGDIELGTLAADQPITENLDADTYFEWRQCTVADGLVLSSFQVLHAAARPDGPPLSLLPAEVRVLARQVIASGTAALRPGATIIERLKVKADTTALLTIDQLLQSSAGATAAEPPPPTPAERSQAGALAAAIDEVAAVIARLPEHVEARRTNELVHLAHELAAVLRETPGTTSPGTSAAARRAARHALPLDTSSRSMLWRALTEVDDRRHWQSALLTFNSLAADLDRQRVDTIRARVRGRQSPLADDVSGDAGADVDTDD
ncbi:MAG: hypothetical protein ACKO27_10295 [Ilumatobacteraceae bacterium]